MLVLSKPAKTVGESGSYAFYKFLVEEIYVSLPMDRIGVARGASL